MKLIGVAPHHVMPELDEGPTLEQEVARVTHGMSAEEMASVGRDVKCQALAGAVRFCIERRAFCTGRRPPYSVWRERSGA